MTNYVMPTSKIHTLLSELFSKNESINLEKYRALKKFVSDLGFIANEQTLKSLDDGWFVETKTGEPLYDDTKKYYEKIILDHYILFSDHDYITRLQIIYNQMKMDDFQDIKDKIIQEILSYNEDQ